MFKISKAREIKLILIVTSEATLHTVLANC